MGLFDFINSIGKKRQRQRLIQTRSLSKAAECGRLETSWPSFPTKIDAHIFQEWLILVTRSRYAAENFDHFNKFVQLVCDNVAGPEGFNLNAQIRDSSGDVDRLTSQAIEDAYEEFSEKGNFDVTGMLPRSDAERLAMSTWATDGEVIIIVCYGREYPHGIAFQFVDPILLNPTYYPSHPLPNGNVIRHGIEMNSSNRPVAYHFTEGDGHYGSITHGYKYTRIPAENVIHWFPIKAVGQKRGLPPGRTALSRLRMLSEFEDNATVNAAIGASKVAFFKNPEASEDDEDIELDARPGVIEDIGNREILSYTPQFPESTIEVFIRTLLRSSGAGLNVSYHNLANDLTSVNFSSIRQGALDEREVWKGLQISFRKGVVMPMYRKWLASALLNDVIAVNGKALKFNRIQKYKSVSFIGRRWPWIDPAAEQTANERAVAQGFKSRSEVIRETSNRDPEDVWDEIQRENIELAKRGIVPLIPSGSVPPEPTVEAVESPSDEY